MRKQSIYDFEKLFTGHHIKKPTKDEATVQRTQHSRHLNNGNKSQAVIKPGAKIQVKTCSSRGSSAQKTSRKSSQGNLHILLQRPIDNKNQSAKDKFSKEEVLDFFNSLGNTVAVKYKPIAMNSQKKNVKRNLTSQLSGLRLSDVEQTFLVTKKVQQPLTNRIQSQLSSRITQQIYKLTHKQSTHSIISSCSSSRYGSVSLRDKPKQSQQKILKPRLPSQNPFTQSLRTETSQKRGLVKPKIPHSKMSRYNSIVLR